MGSIMFVNNLLFLLYNEDLVFVEICNWGVFFIFNVWIFDVYSFWGYYLVVSFFLFCGSFINFVIVIGIGLLVIFVLMSFVGNVGVKIGVLFLVLVWVFFGMFGVNLLVLVCVIVVCFWYGV